MSFVVTIATLLIFLLGAAESWRLRVAEIQFSVGKSFDRHPRLHPIKGSEQL